MKALGLKLALQVRDSALGGEGGGDREVVDEVVLPGPVVAVAVGDVDVDEDVDVRCI